jgi:hypothetical protein
VLPKLSQAVENILHGFIDDPSLFDELLQSFRELKQSLIRRAEMVERRTTEAEQGLQRLDESRLRAESVLNEKLQQHQVSAEVTRIIQQPWVELLSFHLIRNGEDSSSWQSLLNVVDEVVRSLGDSAGHLDAEEQAQRQSALQEMLKDGLEAMGYDHRSAEKLILGIERAQAMAGQTRENSRSQTEQVAPETFVPDKSTPEMSAPEAPACENKVESGKPELSDQEQQMLERVKQCPFGTWFEFHNNEGDKPLSLKLAWSSNVTSHCMFVDQTGVKRGNETLTSLAQGLCSGRIHFADTVKKTFMERALIAVLKRLKLDADQGAA